MMDTDKNTRARPGGPAAAVGPTSFAQQRLWFLDRLAGENPFYTTPVALRLDGALDTGAVERSLQKVVDRHDILRTRFREQGGETVQEVAPELRIAVPVEDLRDVPPTEQERVLLRRLQEEASRTFDLSSLPLLRGRMFELSSSQHVLLLVMHHIVTDGWSIEVLLRELKLLYEAQLAGLDASLPPLSVQYIDHARWQREWLDGDRLDEQLEYWRRRLAGAPRVLELPTDRPRPPAPSYRGRRHPVRIPQALTDGLKQLTRACGATLYMSLLAAFQAFLARYTQQEDVCVGTPVAGRGRKETEGLIGFFVNTVVMRTVVSADEPFSALVERVRDAAMEAYGYLEAPFEKVVEVVDPERSQSRSPLFQVLFAFQTASDEAFQIGAAKVQPIDIDNGTSKFDVTLSLQERGGEIEGIVEYSTDLFDEATIERMVRSFLVLIQAVVTNPDRRIGELDLLDPIEWRHVLYDWNGTRKRVAPASVSIVGRFQECAAAHPDAVAVVSSTRAMRYGELNAFSNRIAGRLRDLGVRRGSLVGVCTNRSVEMVGGVLGVLKAGAAYVPLDPNYPSGRLRLMLEDARIAVVLTQAGVAPSLAGVPNVVVLDDGGIACGEQHNPPLEAQPGDLAYVIYTSGSTGRPKGAGAFHRGVTNLVEWYRDEFGLSAADRGLLVTSFSFDLTQKNIFAAVTTGACLHLAPEPFDPGEVANIVERERITWVNLTPSMFHALGESARGAELASLRLVFLGGEPVQAAKLRELQQLERTRPLYVNTYGPTECSDVAAYHRLAGELESDDGRPVPIGRPLPNVQLYVLDRNLAPLPVGVPGELYIGGEGVGAGYLGRPELTAERFVPDPYGAPGGRLYRSGDLCRWRPSGDVEYLGRIDAQVKIRGFRVEPGEIEVALAQCPAVRDAAVVPVDDAGGGKRLVAYVTPRDAQLPPAELRAHLARTLPEFMVPSAFVWLPTIPLSPNGKVDRKALPMVPEDGWQPGDAPSAALSPVEELVAASWADVLGRDRVSAHASFFELGGHSLLAMQLLARLRARLGVEVPLRAFFEAPTVAALAAHVHAAAVGTAPPRETIVRCATAERPLSFAQQRLWFLDRLDPNSSAYNIPVVLRLEGRMDAEALRASFEEIVRRHEVLRTVFVSRDGEPVQVVRSSARWELPVRDLRALEPGARGARVEQLTRAAALRPFHLGEGPLLRTALLRVGEEEHILLMVMHHVVSDGWSMGVLLREMKRLYAAAVAGAPISLPELPIQYGDFAAWEKSWLRGEALERLVVYWREHLADLPPLNLPGDRPRPARQSHRGGERTFLIDGALASELRRLSTRNGVTLYMTLLAAFEVFLHRHSGQEAFGVGTPVANRAVKEIEELVGFFVNTLVLRADLRGDPTFTELLGRVRADALSAFAHQALPFERLVDEIGVERDLGRNPLFQVMFVLQNTPMEDVALEGLRVGEVRRASETAKFDLTLTVREEAGALAASFEYATDLFDESTVDRMVERLIVLLRGIAQDPGRQVSGLPLVTEAERRQLEAWGRSDELHVTTTIHELFEAQAAQAPGAVALESGASQMTYRELDLRANRVAHCLRRRGVGPETRVAFCLERGMDAVVAMLAILKAGGAYVPIDPMYPAERRSYICADSGAALVITSGALAPTLSGIAKLVIDARACVEELAGAPGTPIAARTSPSGLAYIIYTSGSTGRPKGCMITHANVVRLMRATEPRFRFGPDDRWTVFHSFAFDFSVWEVWGALLYGGRAVIVPYMVSRSPAQLLELVRAHGVTVLNQTPSAFRQLMHEVLSRDELEVLPLRWVIFGGEALDPSTLRPWFDRFGDVRPQLVNMYGITETTVHVTLRMLRASDAQQPTSLVGRPLADLSLHVLDRHLEPAPVGVAGEIFVGGAGCARGYLERPALTAERFIPDPFSPTPGARLYRTGDVGRRLADGDVEYCGRADSQVKIRGFRIEVGEIEAVLREHPAVREALVVTREDRRDDKRLVAYLVRRNGSATTMEVREHLVRTLPPYMVPSAFVWLEALPLTDHGKADRRALPPPEPEASERPYTAPRTEAEKRLCASIAEVVGVPRVGILDNFFAMGGDSLLVIRLLDRLQAMGWSATPADVFEAADVAELARRLRDVQQPFDAPPSAIPPSVERITPEMLDLVRLTQPEIDAIASAVPGGAANIQDIYPAVPLQDVFFGVRAAAPAVDPYVTLTVLPFRTERELDDFAARLQQLVDRHDILRTALLPNGKGGAVQVVCRRARLDVARVQSAGPLDDEEIIAAGRRQAAEIDLARPPLIRARKAARRGEGWRLLVSMHHAILDNMLVRTLGSELQALSAGQALPPTLPFRVFVAYLQSRQSEESERFWRRLLDGVTEPTPPFGRGGVVSRHPRPVGTAQRRSVPRGLAASIRSASRSLAISPATMFHLAFGVVLARWADVEDVVFGTVLSGRLAPIRGVETAAGMFLSTVPVRLRLSGRSVAEALKETQATLAELPAHQHVPLRTIRAWTSIPPSMPVFEALLNCRHAEQVAAPSELRGWGEEQWHHPLYVAVDSDREGFHVTIQESAGVQGKLHLALDRCLQAMVEDVSGPLIAVNPESLLVGRAARRRGSEADEAREVPPELERATGASDQGSRGR